MKYTKKFTVIALFLVALISLFANSSVKAATFPNKITDVYFDGTLKYNGSTQLIYKKYGKGVMFCTSFHINNVGNNCTISSKQFTQPAQAGIAAIINKYNASPSAKNYYYAELAINEFLYYFETKDTINRISTVRDTRNTAEVKPFYDVAVNAYNQAKEKFNIKVSAESDKLSFQLKDGYYISNKLTVLGTNTYDVKVSGTANVEVYNKSGNNFYVRFPSSNLKDGSTITIDVTVTGTKTLSISKNYDCGNNVQTLTPNITENININASSKISGSISKKKEITKLRISKQDITTKEELPGATLVLEAEDGTQVDSWISGSEAHYIEGLNPGKYILRETQAPDGYKLNEETVEFVLEADGQIKEVVMYNTHIQKYKVKISKQDITTKEELAGATLIIKDANGNEIVRWVSGLEPYYLELEKGEYILSEIQAPEGYDLSYEVIKFSVGDQGEVETSVVMYNSKTPNTSDKNIFIIVITMLFATLGGGYSIYKLKKVKSN